MHVVCMFMNMTTELAMPYFSAIYSPGIISTDCRLCYSLMKMKIMHEKFYLLSIDLYNYLIIKYYMFHNFWYQFFSTNFALPILIQLKSH